MYEWKGIRSHGTGDWRDARYYLIEDGKDIEKSLIERDPSLLARDESYASLRDVDSFIIDDSKI